MTEKKSCIVSLIVPSVSRRGNHLRSLREIYSSHFLLDNLVCQCYSSYVYLVHWCPPIYLPGSCNPSPHYPFYQCDLISPPVLWSTCAFIVPVYQLFYLPLVWALCATECRSPCSQWANIYEVRDLCLDFQQPWMGTCGYIGRVGRVARNMESGIMKT